jgi:hypothetical protein
VTGEVGTGHKLVRHEQSSDIGDVVQPAHVCQSVNRNVAG